MSSKDSASLKIPYDRCYIPAAQQFLDSFCMRHQVEPATRTRFIDSAGFLLKMIFDNNSLNKIGRSVETTIRREDDLLTLEIDNKGYPVFDDQGSWSSSLDQKNAEIFKRVKDLVDNVKYENLGRNGQRIAVTLPLEELGSSEALTIKEDSDVPINLRRLSPGEETELSKLFFSVYGYNYINEDVYFPSRLAKMIHDGDLISFVAAMPDGRLAAHVGMLRLSKNPVVYEVALGLTDPNVKSRGLFSKLFQEAMNTADQTPMSYCLFDYVTNHDYSQKLVARYGSVDLAINVGCQISETQAKLSALGLGKDADEMDRYSLLIGIKPQIENPFGKDITLPINLGEMLEFLLEPLGMGWTPAPRFYPLPKNGHFEKKLQTSQNAVYFDLINPGFSALINLSREWRHLLRDGYRYAAVDMPIDHPGVGQAYDFLARQGFFIAGLIPYHFSDRLGIRFQSIGPTKVAFDDIKIASSCGQKLLELIRQDYERNALI